MVLQMDDERKTRENKLRDRLAKKRQAKEEEIQAAALSQEVMPQPSHLVIGCKTPSDAAGYYPVPRVNILKNGFHVPKPGKTWGVGA